MPVSFRRLFPLSIVAALGCSHTTPGASPHDMSAAKHEQHAAAEDRSANRHADRYDATATDETEHCAGRAPNGEASDPVCWTIDTNPTNRELRDARRHHKAAAAHRAASAALREAEAKACVGLSELNRDMSPFVHLGDITSVAQLTRTEQVGKKSREKLVGATVTFRAVEGLTAEGLQRVIDCHLARGAAMGHQMPEMPYCPLVPKGVHALVRATGAGFEVDLTADDAASAAEVLRRAEALRVVPVGKSAAQ